MKDDEFWTRVDRSAGPDACWPWRRHCNADGYGVIRFNGKNHRAHRVAWQLSNGLIPGGEHSGTTCILHSCDNPPCCNPAHLSLGTHLDNMRQCASKGRHARAGGRNPTIRADQEPDAWELLRRGATMSAVGAHFGCSRQSVRRMKERAARDAV